MPERFTSLQRRLMKRIGQVLAILLLTAVALELILQASAPAARYALDRSRPDGSSGELRILCVGDSHTWGAGVPREHSYPAQLEVALRERFPDIRFEVLNFGLPGSNSTRIVKHLESWLVADRADLVIVWVGINNRWNVAGTDDGPDSLLMELRQLVRKSKLLRLAEVAWSHRVSPNPTAAGDEPSDEEMLEAIVRSPSDLELSLFRSRLSIDLNRIVDVGEVWGTPLIFITYPTSGPVLSKPAHRVAASEVILETAKGRGAAFVDADSIYRRALHAGKRPADLIVWFVGPHPSAFFYQQVVEALLPQVERLLPGMAPRVDPGAARLPSVDRHRP